MVDACCCYVGDLGYLFPTTLSALQARRVTGRDEADIKIFSIGDPDPRHAIFERICADNDIELRILPASAVDHMPIMFARFFVGRFLDPAYRAVVYIDGDTQVSATLAPLLKTPLNGAPFLAARDPMAVLISGASRISRDNEAYFRTIGLSDVNISRYFNSGVLRFDLKDWGAISREALAISSRYDHRLKFPDQDALNLAFGGSYATMSYRWNFPTFLMSYGYVDVIRPNLYHFMSNPRPWQGSFRPWGEVWTEPYRTLIDCYPDLKLYRPNLSRAKYVRYYLQQNYKSMLESPFWSSASTRLQFRDIEAEAVV